jgi:hypothetical protein
MEGVTTLAHAARLVALRIREFLRGAFLLAPAAT